jgi:acetyl-CoA acetyltransferase
MGVADKASGMLLTREVTISADEGIRADTTIEGVSKIRSAVPGGVISAGNASQFSDGASVAIVMSAQAWPRPRACSRWACSAASRWPAASRTKWASARCSRCPSC